MKITHQNCYCYQSYIDVIDVWGKKMDFTDYTFGSDLEEYKNNDFIDDLVPLNGLNALDGKIIGTCRSWLKQLASDAVTGIKSALSLLSSALRAVLGKVLSIVHTDRSSGDETKNELPRRFFLPGPG